MLALVHDAPSGAMLAMTNLADKRLSPSTSARTRRRTAHPVEVFADHDYAPVDADLGRIEIGPVRLPLDPAAAHDRGRAGSAPAAHT